ncbi:MAG: hypothetical protein ACRBBO_05980 [Cognatishimia sp.]
MSKVVGALALGGAAVAIYMLWEKNQRANAEFAAEQEAAFYNAQLQLQQQQQAPQRSANPWAPVLQWGIGEIMNSSKSNGGGGFLSGLFGGNKANSGASAGQGGATASGGAGSYFSNGLPASVIGTESGGKTMAYNNEKGAGGHYGHGGRGQFGTARLKDAYRAGALSRPMTAAEYAKQPLAVQERVEKWHVQDIGNYVQRNNLDKYIGQTVNGVKVTPNGMIAAAHLGGSGGLKKWLQTGYNPSDAYGTSLSKYMDIHKGYS